VWDFRAKVKLSVEKRELLNALTRAGVHSAQRQSVRRRPVGFELTS
jgi:hypothetical protein